MADKTANRVYQYTSSTGTGDVILDGAAVFPSFFTADEVGFVVGDNPVAVIEEGDDVEITECTVTATSPFTFSRDTVKLSRISGASGTSKMNLGGSATVQFVVNAERFDLAYQTATGKKDTSASLTTAEKRQARANVAALGGWTLAVITSTNATWPVPSGTKEMLIEAWGGGASGGGQSGGVSTGRGAGGGGGAYLAKLYSGTMDATLNITIGAGGTAASGVAGNAGGDTTVVGSNLGTLTAGGGHGPTAAGTTAGGSGGTATGGTVNFSGGDGHASNNLTGVYGGGGSAPRGGAGAQSNVGAAGTPPGGGGAGENHTGGGSGAGARGEVHIWTRS